MSEPSRPGMLDEIRRVIAGQTKLHAIKLYCDSTGARLAEAREAVERIEAGQPPALLPPRGAGLPPVGAEARAVGEALRAGNALEAVKLYRAATGAGLEEAKRAIDAIMAEKRSCPRPADRRGRVIERRRWSPVLVLLAIAAGFGTAFGLALIFAGR